jgi:hypothetical protein
MLLIVASFARRNPSYAVAMVLCSLRGCLFQIVRELLQGDPVGRVQAFHA